MAVIFVGINLASVQWRSHSTVSFLFSPAMCLSSPNTFKRFDLEVI